MERVRHALRGSLYTPSTAGSHRALDDALLVINGEQIEAVEPWCVPPGPDLPVRDLRPGLMVPGFVDAHLHLNQWPARNRSRPTLLRWLDEVVFPVEARAADPAGSQRVLDGALDDLVAHGVTCLGAWTTSHPQNADRAIRSIRRRGLCAWVGLVLMDRNAPAELQLSTELAIAQMRELAQRHHGEQIRCALTPRFAIACSADLLTAAGRLAADLGLPVQTHLSEQPSEITETLELFPGCSSYAEVYDRFGLLGPSTLAAHCIHLSAAERSLLAERRTVAVHCPTSNDFLGSGTMDLQALRDAGVRVCLGSDVGAGPSCDPFRALLRAVDLHGIGLHEAWRMATLDGAEALGFSCGALEPGRRADLAIYRGFQPPVESALNGLAKAGPRPSTVFVAGRELT
jgi:guanine deaminase